MKKTPLVLLTMFSAVSLAIVGISTNKSPISAFLNATNAEDETTTIPLTSSNQPTITDGSGSLTYNTHASFVYDNVQELDGGHVTLLSGGSIEKNQISKGLSSITAVFDGDLRIQTSYTEGTIDYVYTLTSGVSKNIVGNYFKILTNDGADITSLAIDFNCKNASSGDNGYDLNSYKIVNPSASELITINSFNSTYRQYGLTANVVNVDESPELYIMMAKDQSHSVTADVLLDFTVSELSAYSKVVVTGGGELEFVQSSSNDGIKCNDFVIERGTTLKLRRTEKGGSGIAPKKNLEIYGNLEIRNFNHGVGLNDSKITVNLKKSGSLTIDGCGKGFTCWSPSSGTTVDIAGTANITGVNYGFSNDSGDNKFSANITGNLTISCSQHGFNGSSYKFPLTFDGSAVVNITTTGSDKAGIYMKGSAASFKGHSTVNITATNGYGIYYQSTGCGFDEYSTVNINAKIGLSHSGGWAIRVRGNSTLNIQSSGIGIYNFQKLYVCNDDDTGTVNNASLSVKSSGGNPIQAQSSAATTFIFHTNGSVNIEYNGGTQSKTGIHFGDSVKATSVFKIKCANMTFKNLSNCWGKWASISVTVAYDHDSPFNMIKLINCGNIYNNENNNSTLFGELFSESTVTRQNS